MPEDGADIDGGALGRSEAEAQRLNIHIEQRADATEQVEGVRESENVEERIAGIAGNESTGVVELLPGDNLAAEEGHAERGAGGPPAVEFRAGAGAEGMPEGSRY